MVGNFAIKKHRDKCKSKIGIAWEKFESENVFQKFGNYRFHL